VFTNALELSAADHCNLSCLHCSHLAPLSARRLLSPAALAQWLQWLEPVLRVDEVRLLGGEPLLHPQLTELIRVARASGVSRAIKVITNGLLLDRCPPHLLEIIDVLQVTVYPATRARIQETLPAVVPRLARAGCVLELRESSTFRVTLRPAARGALTRRIFAACELAHDWRCHTLGDGRLYLCAQAYALSATNRAKTADDDSLELRPGIGVLELLSYLEREAPLTGCSSCAGTFGCVSANRQVGKGEFLRQGMPIKWLDKAHLREVERTPGHTGRRTSRALRLAELVYPR
jgi:hypothetical protein